MAKFDRYVNDYQAMLDESLAFLGGFNDYYLRQKVALIEKAVQKKTIRSVLDFGCGLGGTTLMLQEAFADARVVGADISEMSVEQARQQNPNIEFGCIADEAFMTACVGTFDLVYVANVFHHVPLMERTRVIGTLKNMLSPNGKVFFFEHNPYNPVTKCVVSRCEFDRDAILLSPYESRRLFKASGFQVDRTMYLLFFPHMLRVLSRFESSLKWLPLGAQYCVAASLKMNNPIQTRKILENMSAYKIESASSKRGALTCPVCHSSSNLWVQLPTEALFRCVKCDHCFTDISSIAQEESYGSDYYLKTHRNWFKNPNYPLFARLAAEIAIHNAKSVLDVGCGNGAFLKYLEQATEGLDLQGIDLSDAAEQVPGIEFLQGNFLTYDFQKKFDAVVTLAVIEHLSDVSSFVRRIHKLLNKEGMVCVMTLNESGVLYRFANFLRRIGAPSVFVRLYDPHHVNHFSKESLERLLTKDGLFRLKKVIDHNTPLAAIDVSATNIVVKWAMKLGVAAVFFVGKITKTAYLQTILVSKVG